MSAPFRLAEGGRINRAKPIVMRFNGREVPAFEGDTAASALLASGIHFVGRSFKYHRPRGILGHGSEEPNALLDVDRGRNRRDPNNRATVVEAFDGLSLASQNHWPSLHFDVGEINDALGAVFASGFYYKTFMWPPAFWKHVYEPVIRRAAGLGKAPTAPDPDRYTQRHAHVEVLVVGAGPAGVAAALVASADGRRRVMICDEQAECGGSLLHDLTSMVAGMPAQVWLAEAMATLRARANVTILSRTTAFGYYNHNHIALAERITDHLRQPYAKLPRERMWQVRAGQVILATGAHERPLVFADNDRPGIMLAESMRVYVNRYAVLPGRQAVIATTGASAYQAALDLKRAGAEVTVVDLRRDAECGPELGAAIHAGIEVLNAHAVIGTVGHRRVRGLVVARLGETGEPGARRTLVCDCAGVSGGWTPAVHLFSQSRGKLAFAAALDAFVPGASAQAERSAGSCRGIYDLAGCIADGIEAGGGGAGIEASPSFVGSRPASVAPAPAGNQAGQGVRRFPERRHCQGHQACRPRRLRVDRARQALHHHRHGTGPGQDQQHERARRWSPAHSAGRSPAIGTTTFRLPYTPVTFGALAGPARGDLFDPARVTPMHDWAEARDAAFEDVGLWKRAWLLPGHGRGHACRGGTREPWPCAGMSASSMPRRSARSRWSGPTRPSS